VANKALSEVTFQSVFSKFPLLFKQVP